MQAYGLALVSQLQCICLPFVPHAPDLKEHARPKNLQPARQQTYHACNLFLVPRSRWRCWWWRCWWCWRSRCRLEWRLCPSSQIASNLEGTNRSLNCEVKNIKHKKKLYEASVRRVHHHRHRVCHQPHQVNKQKTGPHLAHIAELATSRSLPPQPADNPCG